LVRLMIGEPLAFAASDRSSRALVVDEPRRGVAGKRLTYKTVGGVSA